MCYGVLMIAIKLPRNVPQALARPADVRGAIATRARLASMPRPEEAGGPPLRLFLAEPLGFAEPVLRRFRPPLDIAPAADPKVVMLLPGFAAHPLRMRYMAQQLERAGHVVKRWGLGFNFGPSEGTLEVLEARLEAIHAAHGQKVVLVGWSLGGIFARELAKRRPELVAKVVSMGTPFSRTPYGNNVWRAYHLVTGHAVHAPPIEARLAEKPPVETVALWSPRDGVIAPRCAAGLPGERDRAVALRCSHLGFSNSAQAIHAVLAELTHM